MQDTQKPIVVVGAGLAGAMVALLLAQKVGTSIIVLEGRPDFRKTDYTTSNHMAHAVKRSINLALSFRGICALKAVGLFDKIKDVLIPMKGRVVHQLGGGVEIQPYGVGDEAIYSISRSLLNKLLLDELDLLPNVKLVFDCKINKVTSEGVVYYTKVQAETDQKEGSSSSSSSSSSLFSSSSSSSTSDLPDAILSLFVIGCDGAFSVVRSSLFRLTRVDYSVQYIKHGYKELTIPASVAADGTRSYALPHFNGLHIWPRHEFMLIALPNPDFSFTLTLFAPFKGHDGFDSVNTDDEIKKYFDTYFSDVEPIIPNVLQQYKESPTSALLSIKTDPWHYKDKVVILGDAAHAVVPFFGQGMNAAFEDGLVFSELYDQFNGDPSLLLPAFSSARVEACHALADLSLANYVEMRAKTASRLFVARQYIEKCLHFCLGSLFIPKYSLVAFSRTPYHLAVKRAKLQKKFLDAAIVATAALTLTTLTAAILTRTAGKQSQHQTLPTSEAVTTKLSLPTVNIPVVLPNSINDLFSGFWNSIKSFRQ